MKAVGLRRLLWGLINVALVACPIAPEYDASLRAGLSLEGSGHRVQVMSAGAISGGPVEPCWLSKDARSLLKLQSMYHGADGDVRKTGELVAMSLLRKTEGGITWLFDGDAARVRWRAQAGKTPLITKGGSSKVTHNAVLACGATSSDKGGQRWCAIPKELVANEHEKVPATPKVCSPL